jgi:signal transduction histidine kinase/DNA-binding response OmpR family regulator
MYYLAGVDPDTIITMDQIARYTQLKPGKYHFWTTWFKNEDIWDPRGIHLQVLIPPSWYQTTLARLGYVGLFILIVLGYIRVRTIRLRKEKIRLEREVSYRTAELQLKNEQISEMEALKTRFFTDISHEIRTPLSMIKGPLETLLKQDHRDPKTLYWLEMISRYSEQLLQLVNQLLEISRLDAGYMKMVLEETDVCYAVRQVASEFTSMAERKGIRYVIDIPRDPSIYWFDRAKLERIIVNLISNAIKFTPEMGKVTCRAKILRSTYQDPKMNLRIIISDTGPGIPENERDHIFERFYMSGSDLNRDAGGMGIGLSMVKEMVRLMHGDVCVRNLSGHGSAFIVTIPLGKEHLSREEFTIQTSRPQKISAAERNPQKNSLDTKHGGPAVRKQQVLVVEDNDDLRYFICENLSDQYSLQEAADGNNGFEKAHSSIPDVIISDVMMPGMDGMELCRRIKNDERMSHIPVILLTARSTTADKILGLDVGADDYIYKPFSIDELHARIKNLLEQRELLRRKYSAMIGMDWGSLNVKTIDEQFLKKLTGTIGEHLQDFELNVGFLQEKMFMSREHLYRKVRALTGESPSSLIRLMRLKRAASMLENGEKNITRVAYNAGFASLSYFARRFREYYGKTPSAYRNNIKKTSYSGGS